MPLKKPFAVLAASLLCFGALLAGPMLSAPALAATEEKAPTPAPVHADPALWVVKDKDTTIYLFGTIHVLKPNIHWFDDEIKAAFDQSDELVLEIVQPDQKEMNQKVIALATDRSGTPLTEKLAPEARAKYEAAMDGAGVPWQMFERFEPWFAGLTLSIAPLGKLGYSGETGAEKTLTRAAEATHKRIGALETADQQLGYFDGLPESEQIAYLNSTVDEMPKMETEFAALIDDWARGKPDELAKLMNEDMETTPMLAQVLLYNRNANWAKWIKARLDKPGTVFIAVGAGHLAGPNSVQEKLKALGIRSQRLSKADFALK